MTKRMSLLALVITVASGAHALEGTIAPSIKSQLDGEKYWLNWSGLSNRDYLREINKMKSIRVAMDAKLGDQKTMAKLEFKDKTVPEACEILASGIGAKVFYLRDFLYIAKDLPAGMTPTFAGGPAPVDPKADPKNVKPAPADGGMQQDWTRLPALFSGRPPATSKVLLWQRMGPKDVRASLKPVVMLLADGDEKIDNQQAWMFDTLLLEDPASMKALVDFTYMIITSKDTVGWPAAVTSKMPPKGGAELLLLTCDGTIQASFSGKTPINVQMLGQTAANVLKMNEQLKGNLPAVKEDPKEEKKPDGKGLIPGLPPPKKKDGEEAEDPKDPPKDGKKTGKKEDPPKPKKNGGMNGPGEE